MYYPIVTPIGRVWVMPQGLGSNSTPVMYVQCDWDLMKDMDRYSKPEVSEDPVTPNDIIIRGRRHHGTFHVYQWSNGSWGTCLEYLTDGNYNYREPRQEATKYEMRHSLYLYNLDLSGFNTDATQAAKDYFLEKVMPCITAWADCHQEILLEARIAQLEASIEKDSAELDKTFQELTKKIEEGEQKIESARAHLAILKEEGKHVAR